MGILLSDEEIDLCGIKHILTKEDAQAIAKAQLKKVVELLQRHYLETKRHQQFSGGYDKISYYQVIEIPMVAWQALLKECNDSA